MLGTEIVFTGLFLLGLSEQILYGKRIQAKEVSIGYPTKQIISKYIVMSKSNTNNLKQHFPSKTC